MRGAHHEHVVHVRDTGRVEAQRLVERRRALPSRKEGRTMPGEVRAEGAGGAWAGGSARAACTARGPGCEGLGGYRACAERTSNMPYMVVTLDVSKLSGWLNADVPCRVEGRA
eukprot:scaffold54754_cov65-Phaeocystis_antarctica.AAC.2